VVRFGFIGAVAFDKLRQREQPVAELVEATILKENDYNSTLSAHYSVTADFRFNMRGALRGCPPHGWRSHPPYIEVEVDFNLFIF
jgi:hypothetical protein